MCRTHHFKGIVARVLFLTRLRHVAARIFPEPRIPLRSNSSNARRRTLLRLQLAARSVCRTHHFKRIAARVLFLTRLRHVAARIFPEPRIPLRSNSSNARRRTLLPLQLRAARSVCRTHHFKGIVARVLFLTRLRHVAARIFPEPRIPPRSNSSSARRRTLLRLQLLGARSVCRTDHFKGLVARVLFLARLRHVAARIFPEPRIPQRSHISNALNMHGSKQRISDRVETPLPKPSATGRSSPWLVHPDLFEGSLKDTWSLRGLCF